jgi:hypothetical protein
MTKGSSPTDGGFFIIDEHEKIELIKLNSKIELFFKNMLEVTNS